MTNYSDDSAHTKSAKIKGQEYFLKLVDTAGQDEYSLVPPQYTMDVDGFCLVYSINNKKSFDVIRALYDKLLDLTGKVQLVLHEWLNWLDLLPCLTNSVPIVLVGNKKDLEIDRQVTEDEGKIMASHMKAHFVEISAKNIQTVNGVFESLICMIEKATEDPTPPKSKCLISWSETLDWCLMGIYRHHVSWSDKKTDNHVLYIIT